MTFAQEILEQCANDFHMLFDNCADGVFLLDDVFLDTNEKTCQILGCTREEFVGFTPMNISPAFQPDGRNTAEVARECVANAWAGIPQLISWQNKNKKGELVDVEITLSQVKWNGRGVLLGIVRDVTERNRMELALRISKIKLAINNHIANIFLTIADDKIYAEVLDVVLEVLCSEFGFFGYIDDNGDLVCPSMTRKVWDKCQIPDKSIVLRRETWGGLWGRSLIEKRAFFSNEYLHTPSGHVPLNNALLAPIVHDNQLVGQIAVANKAEGYDDQDLATLKEIANYIAPVLHAREQRKRMEAKLRLQTKHLNERVKELDCLYSVSRLLENYDMPFHQIAHNLVRIVASAFSYPDCASVRITLDEKTFDTEGYHTTRWKHAVPIKVHGDSIGSIEVCYSEIKPDADAGPFLNEEVELLHAVAERVGKVIARQRAEAELVRARLAAESANRIKSNFLANMSHELRTPLTVILGYADLILNNAKDLKCIDMAKYISTNGNHLLTLINDVLDLSKIEAGRLTLETIPCSIKNEIVQIVDMLKSQVDAKGLTMTLIFMGTIPECIECDPTRLRQILMNLIGNAVKFTEHGGVEIDVRYPAENGDLGHIQLDVSDTGIGICPEHLENLFQSFMQGDAATTRKYGGTGLGLAISKRLIELLGGEIHVTSEPGSGTRFTFTLATNLQECHDLMTA
jgi:PAS domain S-box-containing protein